jgi:hypothetical protein
MSINVIERNGSDCKNVEIFIHHVGSAGAPSRKTLFIRGTADMLRIFSRTSINTRTIIYSGAPIFWFQTSTPTINV